jgi:hypothetical protein
VNNRGWLRRYTSCRSRDERFFPQPVVVVTGGFGNEAVDPSHVFPLELYVVSFTEI